jgi:hypothetical protein
MRRRAGDDRKNGNVVLEGASAGSAARFLPPRDAVAARNPRGKWNKIEHRLFSFIARNWRGQPLVSRQVVVSLIGSTTSTAGPKVYAELDENAYERGIKITDTQLAAVNLTPEPFHGERNYTISPHVVP